MRALRCLLGGAALMAAAGLAAPARADEPALPHVNWSFSGPFGTIDRAAAQRGFQVYNDVCANCHSLKEAYYRDLEGIGLSESDVKAIAAGKTVPAIDDNGQPTERAALPSDHFRSPFPNDLAARAALNGGLPPDLSVIIKAREDGANYVYGILTGYENAPPGFHLTSGFYNTYFPGHQIAMPPPLMDGTVNFAISSTAPENQIIGITKGETIEELIEAGSLISEAERAPLNQSITYLKTETSGYRLAYSDTRSIYNYAA